MYSFPYLYVLTLFTHQGLTLSVQNIFARKEITELKFGNQALNLAKIAELKIANEYIFMESKKLGKE